MNKGDKKKAGIAVAVLGLATLGAVVLARKGESAPPEFDGRFAYDSNLIIEPYGGPNDIRWEVSVRNISSEPGTCHMEIWDRLRSSRGVWQPFFLRQSDAVTIQPGDSHLFTGTGSRSAYAYQLMCRSEAGTMLNPPNPLEFICGCCLELHDFLISFATQDGLDAHYEVAHPEYAPMPPCRSFTLRCTAWPAAFYHESWVNPEHELYGRITQWKAEILVRRPVLIEPFDDQDFDLTGLQSDWVSADQGIKFTMPDGWVSSGRGPCGVIPNSTVVKLYFQTDLGWSGWLDYSPWLKRIPDGAVINFNCSDTSTGGWAVP